MAKKNKRSPAPRRAPRGKWDRIRFVLEYGDPPRELNIGFGIVWALHRVLVSSNTQTTDKGVGYNDQGLYDAYNIALFSMAAHQQLRSLSNQRPSQHREPQGFSLDPRTQEELLRIFEEARQSLYDDYPTAEHLLLRVSYNELHAGRFNRAEAAEFASAFLDETIENDTWRKRLDNFIIKYDLDPIKLNPGRPTKPEK